MLNFPKKNKIIISCVVIISLAISSFTLHNFVSANNQDITKDAITNMQMSTGIPLSLLTQMAYCKLIVPNVIKKKLWDKKMLGHYLYTYVGQT